MLLANSDCVAAVPNRVTSRLATLYDLAIFTLPVETTPWTVSLLWSRLADQDTANGWLRQTLEQLCDAI